MKGGIEFESLAEPGNIWEKFADMFEKELLAPIAAKNRIKSEMQSLKKKPARIQLTPEQPWHGPGVHRNRDLGQLVPKG